MVWGFIYCNLEDIEKDSILDYPHPRNCQGKKRRLGGDPVDDFCSNIDNHMLNEDLPDEYKSSFNCDPCQVFARHVPTRVARFQLMGVAGATRWRKGVRSVLRQARRHLDDLQDAAIDGILEEDELFDRIEANVFSWVDHLKRDVEVAKKIILKMKAWEQLESKWRDYESKTLEEKVELIQSIA